MPRYMYGNIVKQFMTDSLRVAEFPDSTPGFSKYVQEKHGITPEQFKEYKGAYIRTILSERFSNALDTFNEEAAHVEGNFKLGDIILTDTKLKLVYVYNPDKHKYMFRMVKPSETVWKEVYQILQLDIVLIGNIFEGILVGAPDNS